MNKIQITDTRIKELVEKGLRHKEMAQQLSEETGTNITASWVKQAMKSLNIRLKRQKSTNVVLVNSATPVEMPEEYSTLDAASQKSDYPDDGSL